MHPGRNKDKYPRQTNTSLSILLKLINLTHEPGLDISCHYSYFATINFISTNKTLNVVIYLMSGFSTLGAIGT